tara:strand:- start:136 stop:318 length:183 start_codon:yes stop_codon:yes gene_type:complete
MIGLSEDFGKSYEHEIDMCIEELYQYIIENNGKVVFTGTKEEYKELKTALDKYCNEHLSD